MLPASPLEAPGAKEKRQQGTPPPVAATPPHVPCRLLLALPEPAPAGQVFALVGSLPELGDWDVTRGLRLGAGGPGGAHLLEATVHLSPGQPFECKVVQLCDGQSPVWEPGNNRRLQVPAGASPSHASTAALLLARNSPTFSLAVPLPPPPPPGERVAPLPELTTTCTVTLLSHSKTALAAGEGEQLLLVGSLPQLGAWEPATAPAFTWLAPGVWQLVVQLPLRSLAEAKLVVREASGELRWEAGPNRLLNASGGLHDIPPGITAAATALVLFEGAPAAAPAVAMLQHATPTPATAPAVTSLQHATQSHQAPGAQTEVQARRAAAGVRPIEKQQSVEQVQERDAPLLVERAPLTPEAEEEDGEGVAGLPMALATAAGLLPDVAAHVGGAADEHQALSRFLALIFTTMHHDLGDASYERTAAAAGRAAAAVGPGGALSALHMLEQHLAELRAELRLLPPTGAMAAAAQGGGASGRTQLPLPLPPPSRGAQGEGGSGVAAALPVALQYAAAADAQSVVAAVDIGVEVCRVPSWPLFDSGTGASALAGLPKGQGGAAEVR